MTASNLFQYEALQSSAYLVCVFMVLQTCSFGATVLPKCFCDAYALVYFIVVFLLFKASLCGKDKVVNFSFPFLCFLLPTLYFSQ